MENKSPKTFGRLNLDADFYSSYYKAESGLFIPCAGLFVYDSFGHVAGSIQKFIGNYKSNVELMTKSWTDNATCETINDGRKGIDEILQITDPKRSFNLAIIPGGIKGMYLPSTKHFFNTERLRRLYISVSILNGEDGLVTDANDDRYKVFLNEWNKLCEDATSYFQSIRREDRFSDYLAKKDVVDLGILTY